MADTKVFLSGGRIQGRSDDSVSVLDDVPNDSWKEIGRFEVTGSATNSFVVRGLNSATSGDMAAKDNLLILLHTQDHSNSGVRAQIRFNTTTADSTGKYSDRSSNAGGATETRSGQDFAYFSESDGDDQTMETAYVRNRDDFVKLYHGEGARSAGTDSSSSIQRYVHAGKWNSTDQITKVHIKAHGGGTYTFGVGTECIVLGCDDDEDGDSGDAFFDKLVTTTPLTSDTSTITGTFTGKKWIMGYAWTYGSGSARNCLRINGQDGGSDYRETYSHEGSTGDASTTSRSNIRMMGENSASHGKFSRFFICKYSGKQPIVHAIGMDDGGSGHGTETEFWESAGKLLSTSAITSVSIFNDESGDFGSGSLFALWGGN